MYNPILENQLIVVGIVDAMQDYCSIQANIDESKVKAAALIAQRLDIRRVIKEDNFQRCLDPQIESDHQLRELIIPALCYFTYARCLKLFHGVLTDGGYVIESEATDRGAAKAVANDMITIGEAFLQEAVDFIKSEDKQTTVTQQSMTPSIRVFGGEEYRASN